MMMTLNNFFRTVPYILISLHARFLGIWMSIHTVIPFLFVLVPTILILTIRTFVIHGKETRYTCTVPYGTGTVYRYNILQLSFSCIGTTVPMFTSSPILISNTSIALKN